MTPTNHGEQGFTLIEFMIAAGLLVVAMSALADTMLLNAKAQRTSTTESQISALFEQIQGIAGSEWSCTASLAHSNYIGPIMIHDPVSPSHVVAQEGQATQSFWTLTSVRLANVVSVTGQPGVYRGALFLQATKNMALNMGNPTVSRSVQDIYFEINPDQTISRCYTTSDTIAAAQSACQLLGGTWNAGASAGSQCTLSHAGS